MYLDSDRNGYHPKMPYTHFDDVSASILLEKYSISVWVMPFPKDERVIKSAEVGHRISIRK